MLLNDKNIKQILYTVVLLIFLLYQKGQAQTSNLDSIAQVFSHYCSDVPREEIYIQSDRDEYISGEFMWFNIYLIDRQSARPSKRSKIVYVELLNSDNFPVIQRKIMMDNPSGPGQILIPDTLSSGEYTFRAYTNWMKNFLPDNCFTKNINIYNSFSLNDFKCKGLNKKFFTQKINIDYFPEGGNLLYGTSGKVAIRIYDEYGRGLELTGKITDEYGDSITSFTTSKSGIGTFEIIPVKNVSLRLSIDNDTNTYVSSIPEAIENGLTMRVNNTKRDTLEIFIITNTKFRPENNNDIILFIQTHGNIDHLSTETLSDYNTKINIPKSDLATGINQIIIFNTDLQLLCERLIFSQQNDNNLISCYIPDSCDTRERVVLNIDLNKELFPSISTTNLSVSVAASGDNQNNPDLDEYLIFGTEFGNLPWILGPDLKFTDIPNEILDNFLLTAKSNWIDCRSVFSVELPVYDNSFEETGYYLAGQLLDNDSPNSNSGKLLFLSSPGKEAIFQYAKTDSNGFFKFMVPFGLKDDLIIQPEEAARNNAIKINSSFSNKYLKTSTLINKGKNSSPAYISNWSVNYQVGKIYRLSSVGPDLTSSIKETHRTRFYRKPDQELIMADYISLPLMEEVFFELLPGVTMKSQKLNYSISISNPSTFMVYNPTLMIDGVIIYEPACIANLDPVNVEKIDIINDDYIVGDYIFNGLLNVITKEANFSSADLPDYAVRLTSRINNPAFSFIAPDYSSNENRESRIPDFRNTLFWESRVKPNSEGKAVIEFWSSDFTSDYEINIQGISEDGQSVSLRKKIKVTHSYY